MEAKTKESRKNINYVFDEMDVARGICLGILISSFFWIFVFFYI